MNPNLLTNIYYHGPSSTARASSSTLCPALLELRPCSSHSQSPSELRIDGQDQLSRHSRHLLHPPQILTRRHPEESQPEPKRRRQRHPQRHARQPSQTKAQRMRSRRHHDRRVTAQAQLLAPIYESTLRSGVRTRRRSSRSLHPPLRKPAGESRRSVPSLPGNLGYRALRSLQTGLGRGSGCSQGLGAGDTGRTSRIERG